MHSTIGKAMTPDLTAAERELAKAFAELDDIQVEMISRGLMSLVWMSGTVLLVYGSRAADLNG
mgnify:CR=1 FL=1